MEGNTCTLGAETSAFAAGLRTVTAKYPKYALCYGVERIVLPAVVAREQLNSIEEPRQVVPHRVHDVSQATVSPRSHRASAAGES